MKKENVTRTKDQEQAIVDFIKGHGFKNIAQFASNVGMERQNVWSRIKGKTDPDIRKLLKWAGVLNCDIDDLIALFYPHDWEQYNS